MNYFTFQPWEIGAGVALLVVLIALVLWLLLRKRPTPDELERQRRQFLSQTGRLVDGMLLDICDFESTDGRMLTLLVYDYRIGGVDYECSQDITMMGDVINVSEIRAGFPCSVRYQPGNPQNSIIISELWSGLRKGLPVLPDYEDPEPIDTSHLRPGRG